MAWIGLSKDDMKRNFNAGKRCGDDWDIMDEKPTGAIRISFGAMSTLQDVTTILEFINEFFVEKEVAMNHLATSPRTARQIGTRKMGGFVSKLTICKYLYASTLTLLNCIQTQSSPAVATKYPLTRLGSSPRPVYNTTGSSSLSILAPEKH